VFNKDIFNPFKTAASIAEFIDEYNTANKPAITETRQPESHRWIALNHDTLKDNVDL